MKTGTRHERWTEAVEWSRGFAEATLERAMEANAPIEEFPGWLDEGYADSVGMRPFESANDALWESAWDEALSRIPVEHGGTL